MLRTLHRSEKFILRQRTRKSNGKKYYELTLNFDKLRWHRFDVDRIRDVIDPTRNRSGHYGTSWRYSNREAAERDLMMLLMKL
jgi:hypothetical protein